MKSHQEEEASHVRRAYRKPDRRRRGPITTVMLTARGHNASTRALDELNRAMRGDPRGGVRIMILRARRETFCAADESRNSNE